MHIPPSTYINPVPTLTSLLYVYSLQRDTAVGKELGLSTGDLASGELSHAAVVGVVHEVVWLGVAFNQ